MSFTLAYAVSNLLMSLISSNWNPNHLIGISLAGMGLSSIGIGLSQDVMQIAAMRLIFGALAAGCNAPLFQIIADRIPLS
jgi:sugar phosphate permease